MTDIADILRDGENVNMPALRQYLADLKAQASGAVDALTTGTVAALVGARVYDTNALLLADTSPALGLYALVTIDPDAALRGLYKRTASPAWTQADIFGSEQLAAYAASAADSAAAAGDAAAGAEVAVLADRVSHALKFPAYNRFAADIGVLKQGTANMPGLFADVAKAPVDGTLFGSFRMASYRIKRDKQVRIMGNSTSAVATGGRWALMWFSESHSITANRGRLSLSFGPNTLGITAGLSAFTLFSDVIAEDAMEAGLAWFVIRAGSTFTFHVIRLDTHAVVSTATGVSASAGLQTAGYTGSAFYIGDSDTVDPATLLATNAVAAAFDGEIDYLGYWNGALTTTDAMNFATGKDPLTFTDAATKLLYDRRLKDLTSASLAPRAGGADTTNAATVLNAHVFRMGSTLRRQALTAYIRPTSRVRNGHCYPVDTRGGLRMARVTWTVEKAGITGFVEGALFNASGTNVTGWQRARVIDANTAEMVCNVPPGIYYRITRDSAAHGLLCVDHRDIRAGSRVPIWSQSPIAIAMFADTRALTYAGQSLVSVTRFENEDEAMHVETHVLTPGAFTFGDGLTALAENWERRFGEPLELVVFADSGTLNLDVLYDADTDRMWSELLTLLDKSGSRRINGLAHSHGNSESGMGENFDIAVFDAVFEGDKPDLSLGGTVTINGTTYSVANGNTASIPAPDHYVFDGDLEGDFMVAVSPVNRTNSYLVNPNYDGARNAAYDWVAARSGRFVMGPEMGLMTSGGVAGPAGGPHPDETHEWGTEYLGAYCAELVARAARLSGFEDPEIAAQSINDARTEVVFDVFMKNGGKLMTGDNATWGSNVQGWRVSTDGGATWTDHLGRNAAASWAVQGVPFTAALAEGRKVKLTISGGAWPANVKFDYLYGTPLSTPNPASDEATRPTRGALFDNRDVWKRRSTGALLGNAVRKMKPVTVA